MRVSELRRALSDIGISDAQSECDIIFREIGGFSPLSIRLDECEIEDDAAKNIIERRRRHEPLAYIIGYADFYRERYRVTPDVLIPRSDTEILVDYAVSHIPAGEHILDLCTGSGCIGISTLRNLKNSRDSRALLVDISASALEVARENVQRHELAQRIELVKMDVLTDLPNGKYYAILSNPPYVSGAEYDELAEEIFFEPRAAFLGGDDGMDFYSSLIPRLGEHLKEGGFIAFEIGYRQAQKITALGESCGYDVEMIYDYGGNSRVAVLRRAMIG